MMAITKRIDSETLVRTTEQKEVISKDNLLKMKKQLEERLQEANDMIALLDATE